MITFAKTLGIEGAKYNILANVIAPIAASQMLASVMPPEMLEQLKPEFVAPLATFLVSEANQGEYQILKNNRFCHSISRAKRLESDFVPSSSYICSLSRHHWTSRRSRSWIHGCSS